MLSNTERSTADLYTEAAQMTDTYSCYKYFPMPDEEVTRFSANISNYAVRGYYLNSDHPLVMMCDNYWPLDRNDKPFGGGVDKPSNNPFKEMVERVIPYSNEANATRIALEDAQFGQLIPDPNLARFRVTTPKAATHLFLEFGFEYSYPEGTSELACAVENYRKLYHGVAGIGKRSLDSHEITFYIITPIDTLPAFSVHFTFAGSETTIANTRPREDIAAQYREDWRKLQIEENYQRMLRHHEQKVENAEYTAEDYEIDQLKARLDQWFMKDDEGAAIYKLIKHHGYDFVDITHQRLGGATYFYIEFHIKDDSPLKHPPVSTDSVGDELFELAKHRFRMLYKWAERLQCVEDAVSAEVEACKKNTSAQ